MNKEEILSKIETSVLGIEQKEKLKEIVNSGQSEDEVIASLEKAGIDTKGIRVSSSATSRLDRMIAESKERKRQRAKTMRDFRNSITRIEQRLKK